MKRFDFGMFDDLNLKVGVTTYRDYSVREFCLGYLERIPKDLIKDWWVKAEACLNYDVLIRIGIMMESATHIAFHLDSFDYTDKSYATVGYTWFEIFYAFTYFPEKVIGPQELFDQVRTGLIKEIPYTNADKRFFEAVYDSVKEVC